MSHPAPVTIGMPVFNGERYLAASIDSILAQTFSDFSLVVSDNASNDGTQAIVLEYARRDARVRYLRSAENHGASWNFNRVFAECDSPVFKWAASDDLLAPTFVERCLELLEASPRDTVVLVAPQTRWVGPDGSFLQDVDDRLHVTQPTPHARLRHVVENVVWGNPTFGLIVADALRRTRGMGAFPSTDLVFLGELALLGEFRLLREPLFFRRQHETMSRQADRTPLELAQFFDPDADRPTNEFRNVFFEYLRGVRHVPLSRTERLRCYAATFAGWSHRYGGPVTRLRQLATRSRS